MLHNEYVSIPLDTEPGHDTLIGRGQIPPSGKIYSPGRRQSYSSAGNASNPNTVTSVGKEVRQIQVEMVERPEAGG